MRKLIGGGLIALALATAAPTQAQPTTAEDALGDTHHLIVQNYGPVVCMNFKLEPTLPMLVGYRKGFEARGFSQAEAATMVSESIAKWCPEEIGRMNSVLGVGGLG